MDGCCIFIVFLLYFLLYVRSYMHRVQAGGSDGRLPGVSDGRSEVMVALK